MTNVSPQENVKYPWIFWGQRSEVCTTKMLPCQSTTPWQRLNSTHSRHQHYTEGEWSTPLSSRFNPTTPLPVGWEGPEPFWTWKREKS